MVAIYKGDLDVNKLMKYIRSEATGFYLTVSFPKTQQLKANDHFPSSCGLVNVLTSHWGNKRV